MSLTRLLNVILSAYLGAVLYFSAITKAGHVSSVSTSIAGISGLAPAIAVAIAYCLILTEVGIGSASLFYLTPRISSSVVLCLCVTFWMWHIINYSIAPNYDCGCGNAKFLWDFGAIVANIGIFLSAGLVPLVSSSGLLSIAVVNCCICFYLKERT